MPRESRAHDDVSEVTLTLQREVNEKLVLAAIQSQQDADDATRARVRAEREAHELKLREEQLCEAAAFRERLIGILGHDLRDPLNTLTMGCGLLVAHGRLTEEDSRLVTRMLSTSQRMGRMIGQLVEFTRARLGGCFELKPIASHLGEICQEVVAELTLGSKIEIDLMSTGELTGVWDADRLVEALVNIVSNALDHAEPSTSVGIRASSEGRDMFVAITNRGVCIPPDVLPFVFDAFRTTERRASSRGGHLGLGLYIANEIVRAHGGEVLVHSAEGATTFTLRLPRVTDLGTQPIQRSAG